MSVTQEKAILDASETLAWSPAREAVSRTPVNQQLRTA